MSVEVKQDCECKGCNLWLRLEAERIDTSYLKKPDSTDLTQPTIVYVSTPSKESKKKRDYRDNLFYHAGRFAGGATDQSAVNSNQELQELLDKES